MVIVFTTKSISSHRCGLDKLVILFRLSFNQISTSQSTCNICKTFSREILFGNLLKSLCKQFLSLFDILIYFAILYIAQFFLGSTFNSNPKLIQLMTQKSEIKRKMVKTLYLEFSCHCIWFSKKTKIKSWLRKIDLYFIDDNPGIIQIWKCGAALYFVILQWNRTADSWSTSK